jgi:hypothetical protein
MKDTTNMTRFSTVEIDFIADDPGPRTAPLSSSGSPGRRLHGSGDVSMNIVGELSGMHAAVILIR